jgi:protein tyrosine/serine phosphatase
MRNFGVVVPGKIFRSGKYLARELKECIRQYEIVRIVDLRSSHRKQLLADSTYNRLGVDFMRFPMDEDKPIPSNALEIYNDEPTLIHCWKGAHRTGAWVAKYRLEKQGWTQRDVCEELFDFGFGDPQEHLDLIKEIINEDVMTSYWEEYERS